MVRLRARDGRDPRELATMDINVHLDNKALKTKYVTVLFDTIAPGYDLFTRLFSFGMDQAWKALLLREGASRAAECPRIVDLACGTGDLGTELARRTGASLAMGLDVSPAPPPVCSSCWVDTATMWTCRSTPICKLSSDVR